MVKTVDKVSASDIKRPDTGKIKELLQSGSISSCQAVLREVLDEIRFGEIKSFMLKLYVCMDIFMAAKGFSKEIGISDERFVSRFGTAEDIEPSLATSEDMTAFLLDTLVQCMEWRAENARANGNDILQTARSYIENCYMNDDISLSIVAEAVGLSPSYLSMLFKKETGQNFSEYLTQVRIHKAKELLCCTSKMVYEVAYDVGFHDYRYFSQIFKKNTGMTPRQFQYSMNVCQ